MLITRRFVNLSYSLQEKRDRRLCIIMHWQTFRCDFRKALNTNALGVWLQKFNFWKVKVYVLYLYAFTVYSYSRFYGEMRYCLFILFSSLGKRFGGAFLLAERSLYPRKTEKVQGFPTTSPLDC